MSLPVCLFACGLIGRSETGARSDFNAVYSVCKMVLSYVLFLAVLPFSS